MADDNSDSYDFDKFRGYALPNTTQIPDEFLDWQMPRLSGAELKVMLYVFRRTLGFKRHEDAISLQQMLTGIVRHDGRRFDCGTGLSRSTLVAAIRSLLDKKLILVEQTVHADGQYESNIYRLNIQAEAPVKDDPRANKEGSSKIEPGVVRKSNGGSTKIELPPSTKNELRGSSKIEPTTNSITTNSSLNTVVDNNNNTEEPDPNPVVVAFLTSHGMSKRVAKVLSLEHPENHIRAKVEYLEFLQRVRPAEVENPPGWLRRAIVDDYAPPPGFISAADQTAQSEQEARRQQEAQAAAQVQDAQRRQAQEEREQRIEALRQQHGTTPLDIAIWSKVMQEISISGEEDLQNALADALILRIEGSIFVVGITSPTAARHMLHPRNQTLVKRITKRALQQEFEIKCVEVGLD